MQPFWLLSTNAVFNHGNLVCRVVRTHLDGRLAARRLTGVGGNFHDVARVAAACGQGAGAM